MPTVDVVDLRKNKVGTVDLPQEVFGCDPRAALVHEAVMQDLPDLSGHQVYACGVPIMVESARRDFVARCALPDDEFYADAFTSEKDKHEAAA